MTASSEARPSSSSMNKEMTALRHLVNASSIERRDNCATMIFNKSVRKLKWGTAIRRFVAQVIAMRDNGAEDSSVRADLIMVTNEDINDL